MRERERERERDYITEGKYAMKVEPIITVFSIIKTSRFRLLHLKEPEVLSI